jgi:hypothetical protein
MERAAETGGPPLPVGGPKRPDGEGKEEADLFVVIEKHIEPRVWRRRGLR